MDWQPIETAPKGRPGFLACNAEEFDSIEWLVDPGAGDKFLNVNSSNYTEKRHWTHWMLLPGPPSKL